MRVVSTVSELRAAVGASPGTVGFAPTMGYLHDGHLSLFDLVRERADVSVASIFVNPLQFGAGEDLDTYPRDTEGDLAKCEAHGVDIVFTPDTDEMYPTGDPLVTVDPGSLADRLCGPHRPGHFRGVLTVVLKMFSMIRPDVAVFGRKDFQQGTLVRRMVGDLNLPIEVVLAPIVREVDGLAMSSRNAYLSDDERRDAAGISGALRRAAADFAEGCTDAGELERGVEDALSGFERLEPEYVEFVDPGDLSPVSTVQEDTVLAVAVHCGRTRLIDNMVMGNPE